jgi:hypothetical protein
MTEELNMRVRLQLVAAYRELCRSVQRSGRENIIFAAIMGGIAYFIHTQGVGNKAILILYGILIVGELFVGFFKWIFPSAEGVLLDAAVLFVFVGFNGWLVYQQMQAGRPVSPVAAFFGLYMLLAAVNRVKSYSALRKLFAERPSREQLAWFNDLIYEIRLSDPQVDRYAIDLPTQPHWRVKFFGSTAFFVPVVGETGVWVAGPNDFTIVREKTDRGTGSRKALLRVHDETFPEFTLSDASWANYTRWLSEQGGSPPT